MVVIRRLRDMVDIASLRDSGRRRGPSAFTIVAAIAVIVLLALAFAGLSGVLRPLS
jgi:hypothetical protein